MSKLHEAARAVVERWDTPLWKDAPATASYINALREALEQPAQAAEPDGNYLTVVYRDLTRDEAQALIYHEKMSAASWSHALYERDAAKAAPQPARQPLTYGLIMQMARDAGLELEPTRNRLIEVRGQHAQLLNLARAIEQAHGIGERE